MCSIFRSFCWNSHRAIAPTTTIQIANSGQYQPEQTIAGETQTVGRNWGSIDRREIVSAIASRSQCKSPSEIRRCLNRSIADLAVSRLEFPVAIAQPSLSSSDRPQLFPICRANVTQFHQLSDTIG
ncbi:hypothetical protein [Baaleninema simplex]|uniref:hypothetical protein n=1 Tax=Baaleninema simplex TaxID=2862350 RepID=UPI00034AB735|nr:hypothetical protein [Baaleninema simplex]